MSIFARKVIYFSALVLTAGALLPPVQGVESSAEIGEKFQVDITKVVDCNRPSRIGDALSVHYRGSLEANGEEFESNYDDDPFKFTLGRGEVIQGWDKGLLNMCVGEHRKLTIPSTMAYGNQATGKIPAGSTLVFETVLEAIAGVESETAPSTAALAAAATATATEPIEAKPAHTEMPGSKDGECRLLGPFAILVQGALGLLALLSLVYKRWRETPPRPLKIWFFDASKQVFGSVLLHLANLFMSMLSSGKLNVAAQRVPTTMLLTRSNERAQPNPCSFYLLNLAMDTTIGIPFLVFLLHVLHRMASHTALARPPESIRSGHYGDPPKASWWFKQAMIYFIGLFGMKICVFFIFQIFPLIAWVGDWALRWTEGNEVVQITFVMFIFPVIMNAVQYYIIDGFIKERQSKTEGHTLLPGEDEDEDDDNTRHAENRPDRNMARYTAARASVDEDEATKMLGKDECGVMTSQVQDDQEDQVLRSESEGSKKKSST